MEAILQDWEGFARLIQPKSGSMSIAALRDDTKAVMQEIADELETQQSDHEQAEKSKGRSLVPTTITSTRHGLERLDAGFGIVELFAEYRALRASVIRLWNEIRPEERIDHNDLIRFNEAIDQRFHEAVFSYSTEKESRLLQFQTIQSQAMEALRLNREELLITNEELEARVQDTQTRYLHAEKLSTVGTLSASVAHELNNPLQAVMTFLKGMRMWAIEEQDTKVLDSVIGEVDRMKRLIRNLSDLHRPSLGNKITMDVNATVDALLLLCKSEFRRKGIAKVVHYAEKLPQILAVPDQIKQVILNLLRNAMDACQSGGVITISTWQEEGSVAVSIKDNGVGIPPEQIDSIFLPFHTTKAESGGSGLGLSVSRDIVHNHNGQIRVESKPGEGSIFTVLLPIDGQ